MLNPFKVYLDISDYNLLVLNDFMRLFIIQLTSQILFKLSHDSTELLSRIFIESTLFISLGVLVYWLLFNHLIVFTNNSESSNKSKFMDTYYQSNYVSI